MIKYTTIKRGKIKVKMSGTHVHFIKPMSILKLKKLKGGIKIK